MWPADNAKCAAHPRVGGENCKCFFACRVCVGSSPRGRGKRSICVVKLAPSGLIPAWAGKTSSRLIYHLIFYGSSPRGRGKRLRGLESDLSEGLIPAWAGKTPPRSGQRQSRPAHPRVGGENFSSPASELSEGGSSPRGRGKLRSTSAARSQSRLIPAWAGKTQSAISEMQDVGAHPRVGGENAQVGIEPPGGAGSSPRGRGKLLFGGVGHCRVRLIPAWAGKTTGQTWRNSQSTAHPRVGGENENPAPPKAAFDGSSPRGRGKLGASRTFRGPCRLIPAWAGKTHERDRPSARSTAHPRVGGENQGDSLPCCQRAGSSPRGRGKHFLTCAFIERIGQILETLELAVSSESYTLSAAYATDAPQDQARNTALVLPSSRGAS